MGSFSSSFTGYLDAPVDGTYAFSVNGDDGVRLWLDGQVVGESLRPDTANQIDVMAPLTAGRHAIRVDHFQRGGGKALGCGGSRRAAPPGSAAPCADARLSQRRYSRMVNRLPLPGVLCTVS